MPTTGATTTSTSANAAAIPTTTEKSNSVSVDTSAISDNLNVIYDNDTTLAELPSSKASDLIASSSQKPSQSNQHHHQHLNQDQQQETASSGKGVNKLSDFVNSDQPEETEKENFATCLLEEFSGQQIAQNLIGRLNFWQPVNNRGVLHLLVRIRYMRINDSQRANSRKRRESFRTPVERAPMNSSSTLLIHPEFSAKFRHQIWLVDNCKSNSLVLNKTNHTNLLAEASIYSDALSSPNRINNTNNNINNTADIFDLDSELIVAKFNLTGTNGLVGRHLNFVVPSGEQVACCQVTNSDILPASELDNLPSISVVQPTPEHLLPEKFRDSNSSSSTNTGTNRNNLSLNNQRI